MNRECCRRNAPPVVAGRRNGVLSIEEGENESASSVREFSSSVGERIWKAPLEAATDRQGAVDRVSRVRRQLTGVTGHG